MHGETVKFTSTDVQFELQLNKHTDIDKNKYKFNVTCHCVMCDYKEALVYHHHNFIQ